MEKYLFIVRSPSGKEIYSTELPVDTGLISMANTIMDCVRDDFPDMVVDYCEIWERAAHGTMNLLATAY